MAIFGGGLFGGNVLPVHCPGRRERQVLVCCILLKNSCQIRHNAYVRIILSDFVRFWCIFRMVSFRRRVRIAGAGFGVLHATQLIGHATRLLFPIMKKFSKSVC